MQRTTILHNPVNPVKESPNDTYGDAMGIKLFFR